MRVKAKVFTTLLAVLLMAVVLQTGAAAAGMGFTVKPVIPSNQRGTVSTYFDLTVQPGQQQNLTLTVTNDSDEDIEITVGAITASTNRNGIVVYNVSDAKMDESLQYNFTDMAQAPEENISIPVGGTREVLVTVNMPDGEFDGVILGAIQITKELSEEERNSGAMILNKYSYVVAVQLTMKEAAVEPDFILGDVEADLVNYRASIVANIHNTAPAIAKGASATAQIFPKGSNTAVFDVTQNEIDFAPNAVFPFSLMDEAGYGLQGGDYTAKVQLTYEGKTWDFEQDFTIEAQEAAAINADSVNQNTQTRMAGSFRRMPIWAIIAIIAGAVIIVVVIILVIRLVRKNKAMTDDLLANLPPIPSLDDDVSVPTEPKDSADTPKTEE